MMIVVVQHSLCLPQQQQQRNYNIITIITNSTATTAAVASVAATITTLTATAAATTAVAAAVAGGDGAVEGYLGVGYVIPDLSDRSKDVTENLNLTLSLFRPEIKRGGK